MDITQLYRLLRRRWPLVVAFAAIGAVLGYASTLLPDDSADAPVVTYWTAGEILRADNSVDIDYVRLAPLAVLGPDAEAVAAGRGVELDDVGLRVVTDVAEATITLSAVDTDPAAARDSAEAFAAGFLDTLVIQERALYDDQLADARVEAQRQEERRQQAQAELDLLDGQEAALEPGETLTPRQLERRGRATATRDDAEALRDTAEATIIELERTGPPAAPMARLQSVPPKAISAGEYRNRLDQAANGANSYTVFDVPSTAGATTASSRFAGPISRAVLGGIAGLILGLMAMIVHARLDTRLRTTADAELAFGLPVLAEVPVMGRRDRRANVLHAAAEPYSRIAEAHRYLRSVLLFARATPDPGDTSAADSPVGAGAEHDDPAPLAVEHDVRVVMITSAGAGEGKTTTAANLAVMMAEAGYETVLMNCDHRRPRMHELAGVPYAPATITATSRPNLRLITDVRRGRNDSPAALSERQRSVITKVRASADVVILDTAPLLATNDALDLLSVTDLVVLVAREGRTTGASAVKAAELVIDRMGVPVAGVVITGSASDDRYYERYRYGGYYGTGKAPDAGHASAPGGPVDQVFDETVPAPAPVPGSSAPEPVAAPATPVAAAAPSPPPPPAPVAESFLGVAAPSVPSPVATPEPFFGAPTPVAPTPAAAPEPFFTYPPVGHAPTSSAHVELPVDPLPAAVWRVDPAPGVAAAAPPVHSPVRHDDLDDTDQPAWLAELTRAARALRAPAGDEVIDLRDARAAGDRTGEPPTRETHKR